VEGLRAVGYRVEQPAFFSWLGATQYLTANAVLETLTEIASLAPGTEVVFTYHVPEDALEEGERQVRRLLSARAARGEAPWISSFDPASLAARLETMGLDAIDFGPDQAGPCYFAERTDDLVVPHLSRVMRARVRPAAEAR
jgi:O-methyltransferase involved in polyketide biosynthesis